jgi:hypothetical protein
LQTVLSEEVKLLAFNYLQFWQHGDNLFAARCVRGKYAKIAHHVPARWRDEGTDSGEQIVRLEEESNGAIAPGLLHGVTELAAGELLQAVLSDGRPAKIAAEPLQLLSVTRPDGDGCVYIEPQRFGNGLSVTGAEWIYKPEDRSSGALSRQSGFSRQASPPAAAP